MSYRYGLYVDTVDEKFDVYQNKPGAQAGARCASSTITRSKASGGGSGLYETVTESGMKISWRMMMSSRCRLQHGMDPLDRRDHDAAGIQHVRALQLLHRQQLREPTPCTGVESSSRALGAGLVGQIVPVDEEQDPPETAME